MGNYLKKIDLKGLDFVSNRCKNNFFDKVMPKITSLGDLGIIWLAIALLLICRANNRTVGFKVISAILITTIIGEGIIKNIVKRQRPFKEKDNGLLINKPITYSFPSGHTASSFAASWASLIAASALNNTIALLAAPIATMIAFSRIYLRVHYPTDVIFGIILGCLCGIWVLTF